MNGAHVKVVLLLGSFTVAPSIGHLIRGCAAIKEVFGTGKGAATTSCDGTDGVAVCGTSPCNGCTVCGVTICGMGAFTTVFSGALTMGGETGNRSSALEVVSAGAGFSAITAFFTTVGFCTFLAKIVDFFSDTDFLGADCVLTTTRFAGT